MLENDKALTLLQQYREGSRRALNDLVILHQPLVGYYARKYFTSLSNHSIIEVDDLISGANIGLLKAIESYNEARGTIFRYYAAHAMKRSIMDFILTNINTIKSPRNKMVSDYNIHKLIEQLEGELKHEVNESDIVDSELFTKDEVDHYYNKIKAEMMPEHFDATDDSEVDDSEEQLTAIKKCLEHLTDREQMIVRHYYAIDDNEKMTLTKMGEKLGVNKQRVLQIRNTALNKIRKWLELAKNNNRAGEE